MGEPQGESNEAEQGKGRKVLFWIVVAVGLLGVGAMWVFVEPFAGFGAGIVVLIVLSILAKATPQQNR